MLLKFIRWYLAKMAVFAKWCTLFAGKQHLLLGFDDTRVGAKCRLQLTLSLPVLLLGLLLDLLMIMTVDDSIFLDDEHDYMGEPTMLILPVNEATTLSAVANQH